MHSVGYWKRPSVIEHPRNQERETHHHNCISHPRDFLHPWQEQHQQQPDSRCPSEAATACETLSPCCSACFYRGAAEAEIPNEGEVKKHSDEMYFYACGKSRQHPLKAAPYQTTNADAFLIDSQIVGVADGVGSVETEGYDPALLPVELLTQCSVLFRVRQQNAALFDAESESLWTSSSGITDDFDAECFPLHILARAHASCLSLGSTTCVLGMLDTSRRRLYTVNVGDSQLLLLRRVCQNSQPARRKNKTRHAEEEARPAARTTTTQERLPRPDSSLATPVFHVPALQGNEATVRDPQSLKEAPAGSAAPSTVAAGVAKVQLTAAKEKELSEGAKREAVQAERGRVANSSAALAFDARTGTPAASTADPPQSAATATALAHTEDRPLPSGHTSIRGKDFSARAEDARGSDRGQAHERQHSPVSGGRAWTRSSTSSRNDAAERGSALQLSLADDDMAYGRDDSTGGKNKECSPPDNERRQRLRENRRGEEKGYQVVYRTEVQQHFFNCPYQLTRMPDVDCSQEAVLQRTQACADLGFCGVKGGDVVILGSDGLFDNLFEEDIVAVVNTFCCRTGSNTGGDTAAPPAVDPALVADQLLNMALAAAAGGRDEGTATAARKQEQDRCRSSARIGSPPTPFSEAAYKELGRHVEGGKPDDTTVVVAYVIDPQQPPQQPWRKHRSSPRAQKTCAASVGSGVPSEVAMRGKDASFSQKLTLRRSPPAAARADARRGESGASAGVRQAAYNASTRNGETHEHTVGSASDSTAAESAAAAAPASARAAAEIRVIVPAVADFAGRRAATSSNETLGTAVSKDTLLQTAPATSSSFLTSSVVAHGSCQNRALVSAAECCSSNEAADVAMHGRARDACAAAVQADLFENERSKAVIKTANQSPVRVDNVLHSMPMKRNTRHLDSVAEFAEPVAGNSRAAVRCEDTDNRVSRLVQKAEEQAAVVALGMLPSWRPANNNTRGQQQQPVHPSATSAAERDAATKRSTRATETNRAPASNLRATMHAAQAKQADPLPVARNWCLFRQAQANPHSLSLVVRAAPTAASTRKTVHDSCSKIPLDSKLPPTGSKQLRTSRGRCTLEKRRSQRRSSRSSHTTGDTWTAPEDPPSKAARETCAFTSVAQTAAMGAAAGSSTNSTAGEAERITLASSLRETRLCASPCCALPDGDAAAAAAATRKGSNCDTRGRRTAAALLASAAFTNQQQAAALSSSVSSHTYASSAVDDASLCSARMSDGGPTRSPTGPPTSSPTDTSNAATAAAASGTPVSSRTDALASPIPPAVDGACPGTAGGIFPAGFIRQVPVSVSTVLACTRRSFPPVNAAAIMRTPAVQRDRKYAADKSKSLTPVAVAAALGAGTSPACVAAVHMKIL